MIGRMYVPQKMVYDYNNYGYNIVLKYKSNFGHNGFFNLDAYVGSKDGVDILVAEISNLDIDVLYTTKKSVDIMTVDVSKLDKPVRNIPSEYDRSSVLAGKSSPLEFPYKMYRPFDTNYDRKMEFGIPTKTIETGKNEQSITFELFPRLVETENKDGTVDIAEVMVVKIFNTTFPVVVVQ